MTFPILGGNGAVGGYSIDNSLRFNDNDSAKLTRTPASDGDRQKWTINFWVKRANLSDGLVFSTGTYSEAIRFSSNTIYIQVSNNNTTAHALQTNRLFRDVSAWYMITVSCDTTQATASNRLKLYVNGLEETSFSTDQRSAITQNMSTAICGQFEHRFGVDESSAYFDGYIAEAHLIDGQQLSPTDFGEFDEDSGIWKPIRYSGSYGTNGFYLDFENSGSLGADQSGNGNNFTPTNLASTDQTTDTPTNNFATFNPLARNNGNTYTEGNTTYDYANNFMRNGVATMGMSSGKWYAEFQKSDGGTIHLFGVVAENYVSDGRTVTDTSGNNDYGRGHTGTLYLQSFNSSQDIYQDGSDTGTNVDFTSTTNDIIMIAFDVDTKKIWFGKNGTWSNSGNPATGTNPSYTYSGTGEAPFYFSVGTEGTSVIRGNFGNPSFSISSGNSDQNGYGNFEYAPPSGYLALCTQNLATELSPTIDDASAHFQVKLYSGNNTETAITYDGNSNLQPDFIWAKSRTNTYWHDWRDTSRGLTKRLTSNDTNLEDTKSASYVSFDSNGFTLGDDIQGGSPANTVNSSGNFVSWGWKAGGGTTSSNTDGSITSTVQANTTAGFSIVTWTGDGTEADIGHGLGVNPDMIILKDRDASANWLVYHSSNGENKYLKLNETSASSGTVGQNLFSGNNSLTFGVGSGYSSNTSGNKMLAYCFADIEGYSKFGSYTGNGSTDGTFVYTGFRPAFVIIKTYTNTVSWVMLDNKRNTYNAVEKFLYPDLSNAEGTLLNIDYLSNGFKLRTTSTLANASGYGYIYMAFAESPFVTSSGVPVVAR